MDEIDAIGGRRFSEGTSADREIQRTLMELLNQLDGFDNLGKVLISVSESYIYMCIRLGCEVIFLSQTISYTLKAIINAIKCLRVLMNVFKLECIR